MIKDLKETDPGYKRIGQSEKKERIAYCEQLIDKTQKRLAQNNQLISQKQKEQMTEVIMSAQREIRRLNDEAG
jgi:hypothetical protein